MKYLLLSLISIFSIYNCNSLSNYDKYLNRDISSIILRNSEIPFYASDKLYSSHYVKMNIIDIPNIPNYKFNKTNIDIKK